MSSTLGCTKLSVLSRLAYTAGDDSWICVLETSSFEIYCGFIFPGLIDWNCSFRMWSVTILMMGLILYLWRILLIIIHTLQTVSLRNLLHLYRLQGKSRLLKIFTTYCLSFIAEGFNFLWWKYVWVWDIDLCCLIFDLFIFIAFESANKIFQKNQIFIILADVARERVTSGGVPVSCLVPGLHSFEETLKRWPAVGDTVSDLTGPGIEPQTYRTDSYVLNDWLNRPHYLSAT